MITTSILLTLVAGGPAAANEGVSTEAEAAYARVLANHVADGRVNYRALGADRKDLDLYVEAIATATPPTNRNDRIAFYVDAYNALVLKAVLDHGRPRSVLDVKGFFNADKHQVAGRSLTLDELEKKVLNPFAKDPRTHFVLVCGAVGCPVLEPKPFLGTKMSQRMEKAARRYLRVPQGAQVEPGQLKLSKIFDWYKADFGGEAGALKFVLERLTPADKTKAGDAPKVSFIDYNWTLNQR